MVEGRASLGWFDEFIQSLMGTSRVLKQTIVGSADLAACVVAVWLSFTVRLGSWVGVERGVVVFAGAAVVTMYGVFIGFGVYRNVFRFHGPRSVGLLARSCAVIAIPLIAVFGYVSVPGIPRTVSVIFPLVLFTLITSGRIVMRFVVTDLVDDASAIQRVLIYGAGRAGSQLAASLHNERTYKLVGFVDDDPAIARQRLEGIPITHSSALDDFLETQDIDTVLIAMPSLGRSGLAKIYERLRPHDTRVMTLPSVADIVSGQVSVNDLREIQITDLLQRDPIAPDPALMTAAIEGKVVLVTGAGGSIGSELCRQILPIGPCRLILFEMSEASLYSIEQELRESLRYSVQDVELIPELGNAVDRETVDRLFARWRPDTVFHAAAYKHVPLVEANSVSGIRNNVFGTLHCAQAAITHGAERFVLISTDKAVRPTNVMGASKRVCELILQALAASEPGDTILTMVRFGNVLGSSGSVVPQFKRQIAEGGPVTITHRDITRFFMTIPEAAELVIQAGAMARGGEVYLLDMGEPVKILDLASTMITLSGLTVRDADNPDGDIEIREVGLRPGEKLYEELLIEAAAGPTSHERIFVAREEFYCWDELCPALSDLRVAVADGDSDVAIGVLTDLVNGFTHPRARRAQNRMQK